ncbi:hypothetical protein [Erythrobacter sp.]|uniref:hypothetical protein n=1 Tax=Erythrobacter sp. TaxID=1042 RepID=UPI001425C874|nr:hypothetical protein [Erythrobacter sp.]QIQ86291.1 MAG: hypothetical protein G9473_06030 [Erythrobacter sp.]
MKKRPILVSVVYWIAVQLIIAGNYFKCGFGAGWDEESYRRMADCRGGAMLENEMIATIAIVVYAAWAVVTIKGLQRKGSE